ncbi:uncharacterized protein CC84DRAFT_1178403 [Paraphaeosphaeria sporulosa]|uniref:Uncharacterized protein n=1 Tax=Paraphaeosphaeria sporulosa TaxID=1460663 RepID=A0A177C5X1_9PLEO|nr:uncharacterized protein CC84DRAFT_1178403 [Paraphaeosphaeria sporulosa]OAG02816.1 hypothetical protein CC84DRAFT_1178403 [Paraphaeosphaeria sporulosa]
MLQLIRTLCNRPDLCEKISSVDLDDYTKTGPPQLLPWIAEWRCLKRCRKIVAAEVFDEIVSDEHADDVQLLWSKNHRFLLDVLIASCPNIKKLSLRLPGSEQDPLFIISGSEDITLLDLFSGVSRRLLGEQLQSLTIRETDSHTTLFRTPNVTLAFFSNLTHLSIPTDVLIFMDRKPTAVSQALPSSLRHLHIKPCSLYVSLWFPSFAAACVKGVLPRLCHVDFHFRTSLKDSLIWIDQGRGLLSSMRDLIDLLKRKHGISLRGYNESGICTGDLLEELDAWSHLSTTELWYPAAKDAEFSSIVARSKEGAPRRRTEEEIRTYIKRDRLSQKLVFTRKYIFKPDVQLQVTAPRSFSTNVEELPKIVTPRFSNEFARWLASVAAAQRMSEPTLRGALAHLSLSSQFEEEKLAITTAVTFQASNHWPLPRVAFDSNQWLGLKFFENVRSKMGKISVIPKRKSNHKREHTVARPSSKVRRVKPKLSD